MEVDGQCQEMAAVYSRKRNYAKPALLSQSLSVEGNTADILLSWPGLSCGKDRLWNHKDEIFFIRFSVSFLRDITDSPVTCNLYFRREVLPCVVKRRLTQSSHSLVSCWRSSCTGRPAALFGCDKNRCRLPQFIDLPHLHVTLFLSDLQYILFPLFCTYMITGCIITE